MAHLQNLGRSLIAFAHVAAAESIDANGRAAADAAAQKFVRELGQRIEVTVAQAADIPQTVNKKAFAVLVHAITREYVRGLVAEAERILKGGT